MTDNQQATRDLREIPTKREPFLCRVGIHKWSVWGDKFSIPSSSYAFEFQQKACVLCGIVCERRIES